MRVVIYNDNGANEPDGEPNDDGTIDGGPAGADVQVGPDAFSFVDLGGNDFEITLSTALGLEKHVMDWVARSPMLSCAGEGQGGRGSVGE